MILIISTCSDRLSEEEFVNPIADIIKEHFVIKHYSKTEEKDISEADKIIICGTALKDNKYLDGLKYFNWIKKIDKPVLGICSGMQIIALQFEAKINENKEIGMAKIKTTKKNKLFSGNFEAYGLHGNGLSELSKFDILSKSEKSVQGIKHKTKEIYGIMFHPEVRNKEIIKRFII